MRRAVATIGSGIVTEEWGVPAWLAVLAVVALASLLLLTLRLVREMADHRHLLAALRDDVARRSLLQAETADRLARVERRLARLHQHADTEFVITGLGDLGDLRDVGEPGEHPLDAEPAASAPVPAASIDAPLFADLVLRESVVQVASFAQGLRRALAPETRNRIRFEMRREVKRSRRQRRQDNRLARRAWEAQQRRQETVTP